MKWFGKQLALRFLSAGFAIGLIAAILWLGMQPASAIGFANSLTWEPDVTEQEILFQISRQNLAWGFVSEGLYITNEGEMFFVSLGQP